MVSFRKNLIMILAGVVCLNFLLVYVSFNYLMAQYIHREAENGVNSSVRTLATTVELSKGEGEFEAGEMEDYVIVMDDEFSHASPSFEMVEADGIALAISAMPAVSSILSMEYIILDQNNQVVFPENTAVMNSTAAILEPGEDVSFVVEYYTADPTAFADREFVRITNGEGAVYMSAVSLDDGYSVVAFTDTTKLGGFTKAMNWTLGGLMMLSGLVAVLAGIRMSGGMNRTLKDLGCYARRIGEGDFAKEEHRSRYTELDQLGKSMADMSSKLKLYDEQQKEFFQNASHELRTPLMSIQGYAEGIASDVFEDKTEAAGIIVEESKEMASLVSRLLYISRLDTQMGQPSLEETDLRDVLSAVWEKVTAAAASLGKEVELKLPQSPARMEADPNQLITAFTNIAENGLRYAEKKVVISLKEAKGSGQRLEVTIADDGRGIDEKDLPHIFERLYKGPGGNAGLGLAIAEKVIMAHRGDIQGGNRDGGGALFTVTFE